MCRNQFSISPHIEINPLLTFCVVLLLTADVVEPCGCHSSEIRRAFSFSPFLFSSSCSYSYRRKKHWLDHIHELGKTGPADYLFPIMHHTSGGGFPCYDSDDVTDELKFTLCGHLIHTSRPAIATPTGRFIQLKLPHSFVTIHNLELDPTH